MKVKPGSWGSVEGEFVGNECSWPAPSGNGIHGCKQAHVNAFIIELARRMGGNPLLTLDAHFVKPETKMIQDILLQNGNKNGWRASSAYYQMDTAQAWEAWSRNHSMIPEFRSVFEEAVENNTLFTSMVEPIELPKKFHLPEVQFPPSISSMPGSPTEAQKLMALVLHRIRHHGRMPRDQKISGIYLERLSKELEVIANNGVVNFLPYFLIIDLDICDYARSCGHLVGPGRGSAAGCLLAYLLKITHIDPIIWELSFERFLSMGRIKRGKFPDIDLDFGDPKIVVEYLSSKYGEKFARICTTGTAKLKGAIRDVSRILLNTQDDPALAAEVNEVCKAVGNVPQGADTYKWLYGYEQDGVIHPGHIHENRVLSSFFESFPAVKTAVDQVLDVPRSVGRHASAYCISDEPIGDLVPMCQIKGEKCTQFTMDPVQDLGLIKMDFLGLNTLNDIKGAIDIIKERRGVEIDIYRMEFPGQETSMGDKRRGINICDAKVFKAFCNGDTATVFQFKSQIATDLCRTIRPKSIMDLANITANGRPGTMYALMEDGKTTLIDEWKERRRGVKQITYLHEDLESILKPTDGIFTFQEQVMAAFMKSCGFTEEKSDEIREIIGKKKEDKMQELIPDIRQRLCARGWNEAQIESFISLCIAASSYSFNKSHSVAYSYIGYVCMWLKENFKLEWWNSVLQNSSHDDLKDASRHIHDIVIPPDINVSSIDFYIIDDQISKLVFPLNKVKNVKGAGECIKNAREDEDGFYKPFTSLADFYQRVDRRKVNKRVVASLIWSGAFDKLCGVEKIVDRNVIYREYLGLKDDKELKSFVDFSEPQAVIAQAQLLAISSTCLADFISRSLNLPILGMNEALKKPVKSNVRIGGIITGVRAVKTKTGRNPGQSMAFVDIEDSGITISVTLFPEQYSAYKEGLKEGTIVAVDATVGEYKGQPALTGNKVVEVKPEIETLQLDEQ